jgi:hypothetical protein
LDTGERINSPQNIAMKRNENKWLLMENASFVASN